MRLIRTKKTKKKTNKRRMCDMCLYSKTKEASLTTEDIPVYKILRVNIYGLGKDSGTSKFFTPLFNKPVAVPSTIWCRGKEQVTECTMPGGDTLFAIGKGMIHCLPCDKSEVYNSSLSSKLTLVASGYIPKGTPYYEQLDDEICLCAKKIRLERIAAQSEYLAAMEYLPDIPPLSQWLESEEK